jgi:hypothetical protein
MHSKLSELVFEYRELQRDPTEIRLLRIQPRNLSNRVVGEIQCELFHAPVRQAPLYDALSYTWGEASDPHKSILVNGQPLPG